MLQRAVRPPSCLIWLVLLTLLSGWVQPAFARPPYQSEQPEVSPALAGMLDQLAESALKSTNSPGVVIAVSLPGQGNYTTARGLANSAQGIPMTPNEQFRIASLSKMFVAVVVLQLVQEGTLTLDQTVEQWLPGMVPNGKRITIRQLLNHTSGLYDYLTDSFAYRALETPQRVWMPNELVAVATANRPTFAPGAAGRWSYSNTNYVLLGLIVEQATGQPLHMAIRERILDPLGMQATVFEPAERPATLMHSYVRGIDRTAINMSFAWAAGSMSSTAGDLERFARALFEGALLSPNSMQQIQTFVDTKGKLGRAGQRYGLGLIEDRFGSGKALAYGHTGSLIGSRTALWYFPESKLVVVIALNTMKAAPDTLMPAILDNIRMTMPALFAEASGDK